MKTKKLVALALLGGGALISGGTASAALVVYEGFDYTAGTDFANGANAGLNGGTGFGGSWNGAIPTGGTVNSHEVVSGLTLTGLTTTGEAAGRDPRNGRSTISRSISAASQTALTGDGSTIWFSVLMDPRVDGVAANAAFENNTRGTFVFGDVALTDANATAPATLSGNGIGVAFGGSGGGTVDNTNFTNSNIVGVTYSGGAATVGGGTGAVGDVVSMIVGQIDWAAGGSNDTITLYNVLDPTAPLPAAFATMTADLNQSTFNVVSVAEGQMSVFDEIRFGMTAEDVGVVPEPSSLSLLALSGLALLRRRRA